MAQKNILVAGGAGYIGSYVAHMLQKQGFKTIVLDNLSRSHKNNTLNGEFFQGNIGDTKLLDTIFSHHSIDAVMHFAAFIDVGESIRHPLAYYTNNVTQTLSLLHSMIKHEVKTIIFSSTAAIFGYPQTFPIDENHPCLPINPYGNSKWMVEKILKDLNQSHGLKSCCLRYFNAAGGDPEGKIKHAQTHVSNLIPLALRCIKNNTPLTIFGQDYPTPDGTCIRDYIHIEDLGTAHLLALQKLAAGSSSCCYNLGNGQGYSVKEVIKMVEKVTNQNLKVIQGERRQGDPPILVANARLAAQELKWIPQFPNLETMVEHAWQGMNECEANE